MNDPITPVVSLLGPWWGAAAFVVFGIILPRLASGASGHPLIQKVLGGLSKAWSRLMGSGTPAPTTPVPTAPPAVDPVVNHPVIQEIRDALRALLGKSTPAALVLLGLVLLAGQVLAGPQHAVQVWCVAAPGHPTHGGSGVVVACDGTRSLVLTNRHVAENSSSHVVVAGGVTHPARLVAYHEAADLAGLIVEAKLTPASIADAPPADGQPVTLYGFPAATQGRLDVKRGVAAGHFLASVGGRPWCYQFRTTFISQSGDSGGGVFDQNDCVCAINWGHDAPPDRPPSRSECVCLRDLKQFVARHWAGKACQCGDGCPCPDGSRCGDGVCPIAKAAAVDDAYRDYRKAHAEVLQGKRVIVAVGVAAPPGSYFVPQLEGFPPGLYDCWLAGGQPKMTPQGASSPPAAPSPSCPSCPSCPNCPNGRCPLPQRR